MVCLKQRLPIVSRYVVQPDGMRHDEELVNGEAYPRDNGGENVKEKGAEAKAVLCVLESRLGHDTKAYAEQSRKPPTSHVSLQSHQLPTSIECSASCLVVIEGQISSEPRKCSIYDAACRSQNSDGGEQCEKRVVRSFVAINERPSHLQQSDASMIMAQVCVRTNDWHKEQHGAGHQKAEHHASVSQMLRRDEAVQQCRQDRGRQEADENPSHRIMTLENSLEKEEGSEDGLTG